MMRPEDVAPVKTAAETPSWKGETAHPLHGGAVFGCLPMVLKGGMDERPYG